MTFVLAFLIDDRALNVTVQEVKRVHLVPLNGEPVATEVEFGPTRQIVFVPGFLGDGY